MKSELVTYQREPWAWWGLLPRGRTERGTRCCSALWCCACCLRWPRAFYTKFAVVIEAARWPLDPIILCAGNRTHRSLSTSMFRHGRLRGDNVSHLLQFLEACKVTIGVTALVSHHKLVKRILTELLGFDAFEKHNCAFGRKYIHQYGLHVHTKIHDDKY